MSVTSLLLDSNALLWWAMDDEILSADAREAIESSRSRVSISVATAWELEIKRQSGKLTFDFAAWRNVGSAQVEILVVELADAIEAARLPLNHRDPFDRMIIAQARNRGLTIVTSDRVFDLYDVSVMRA